jgi:hypothetical protein
LQYADFPASHDVHPGTAPRSWEKQAGYVLHSSEKTMPQSIFFVLSCYSQLGEMDF